MERIVIPNSLDWKEGKIKGFLSKQLIEIDNGGLKLIKVEPNSFYPVHNHPEKTEFVYVLKGTPEIIIGDNTYSGKEEEFFIFPKSVNHGIGNVGSQNCTLLVGFIKS